MQREQTSQKPFVLQAPCRAELQRALDRLASNTRTHDDLFTIPIPNCDRNGDFHAKQVCDFMSFIKYWANHYLAMCTGKLWVLSLSVLSQHK